MVSLPSSQGLQNVVHVLLVGVGVGAIQKTQCGIEQINRIPGVLLEESLGPIEGLRSTRGSTLIDSRVQVLKTSIPFQYIQKAT